jgi:hypothetical protein
VQIRWNLWKWTAAAELVGQVYMAGQGNRENRRGAAVGVGFSGRGGITESAVGNVLVNSLYPCAVNNRSIHKFPKPTLCSRDNKGRGFFVFFGSSSEPSCARRRIYIYIHTYTIWINRRQTRPRTRSRGGTTNSLARWRHCAPAVPPTFDVVTLTMLRVWTNARGWSYYCAIWCEYCGGGNKVIKL